MKWLGLKAKRLSKHHQLQPDNLCLDRKENCVTEPPLILALLLAMFCLFFLLLVKLIGFFYRRALSWHWIGTLGVFLWILAVLLLVLDVIEVSHAMFFGGRHVIVELLLLIALVVVTTAGIHYFGKRSSQRPTSWRIRVTATAIICLLLGWTGYRFEARTTNYSQFGIISSMSCEVNLDDRFVCETDLGTRIPVFRLSLPSSILQSYSKTFQSRFGNFGNSLIHRGDADEHANCHGWVFTGGKFLLKSEGVEQILQDHDYSAVEVPKPHDLVVYRSGAGQILHTAIVQAILDDGTVITESKWGVEQRFLHLPNDQPFSTFFQYYRSNRPNHLVKIESVEKVQTDSETSNSSMVEHGDLIGDDG